MFFSLLQNENVNSQSDLEFAKALQACADLSHRACRSGYSKHPPAYVCLLL